MAVTEGDHDLRRVKVQPSTLRYRPKVMGRTILAKNLNPVRRPTVKTKRNKNNNDIS